MPAGRPSGYSDKLANTICLRLSDGESLRQICKSEDMPCRTSVFKWLSEKKEFADQYARAREAQMDAMADEILDIADSGDPEQANWLKLRVDTRKWLMGKLHPKKYGEKQTIEATGTVGVQLIHSIPRPER